ncbi:hypothetical protein Tco_1448521 [Tanacetum coccineum]
MAALESCPKHNMIAYLEKTEGNVEFHEVIDFLQRSYIFHALTVSPVISTTFVEQFWTSAKSKTINNVRHITAKVAGKVVSISEASIRTELIFDDADGIDSLPNQAIFNAIQRMGYEGDLSKVTPLFDTMLVQPTQDEGASSESQSVEQSSPSPTPTGEVPNESLPDSTFCSQPSESILKGAKDNKGRGLTKKRGCSKSFESKTREEEWQMVMVKQKRKCLSKGRMVKRMMNEDKENEKVSLSTEDEVSTAKEGPHSHHHGGKAKATSNEKEERQKERRRFEEGHETESEDDDIPQVLKKFNSLKMMKKLARKVKKSGTAAEEKKPKLLMKGSSNEALVNNIDDVKAKN